MRIDAQGRFADGDQRRRGDGGGGVLEAEDGGGELDFAAVFQPGGTALVQFTSIDTDAVLAAEVADLVGTVDVADLGVAARGKLIIENDVGVLAAAKHDGAVGQLEFSTRPRSG